MWPCGRTIIRPYDHMKYDPNDIVYIPNTRLVKWNAVISLLTPSESLFKTYKPYIKEDDNWYIENSKTN